MKWILKKLSDHYFRKHVEAMKHAVEVIDRIPDRVELLKDYSAR